MLRFFFIILAALGTPFLLTYVLEKDLQNPDEYKQSQLKKPSLTPPNPAAPQPPSHSLLHIYENAAICSDSQTCSAIGKQMLQMGGHAVDAAIATLFCNGLLAMQSMGLGGGMIMNIYEHQTRSSTTIEAREQAPSHVNADAYSRFGNATDLFHSPLSIAVPSELRGYAEAHRRFGVLKWSQLVQPSVDVCRRGYILTKHQRDSLDMSRRMLLQDPHLRHMFYDEISKDFHKAGTHVMPPHQLCHTLEEIALKGPDTFYTGELGKNVLKDLHDMGSAINEHDLSGLRAQVLKSLSMPIDGYTLHLTPPPSSGYILAFIMNILEEFRGDFMRANAMNGREMHRIAEALKFAFAKRWEMDIDLDEENITSHQHAASIAKLIDDSMAHSKPQYYGAHPAVTSHKEYGTAHISVLAPNGDAVSVSSTINFYFGSGRMGKRTGILFNNAMADFSVDGVPNYFDLPNVPGRNNIKPGRSPISSISPTIVTTPDGRVRLVVGAAGGSKILSVLTQILVRILWFGENIKQAIDAARFHHQLLPNIFEYEYGVEDDSIQHLQGINHETRRHRAGGTAVCGVEYVKSHLFGNADYRKDGGLAGF